MGIRTWRQQVFATAVLLSTAFVCIVPFFPGRMNADTIAEIQGITDGQISDRYAPVLQAIWTPLFNLGAGPGWVFVLQVAVTLAGSYLILRLTLSRVFAALGAAFVAFTPTVYGALALVGRDAWFAAGLVLMFGATARTLTSDGRTRVTWFVVALAAGWAALAARQNAAAAVVVGVVLLVALWRDPSEPRRNTRFIASTIGIAIVVVLTAMASQFAISKAIGLKPQHPAAPLHAYDLAAMGAEDNANYFPEHEFSRHDARTAATHFNVDDAMSLIVLPDAPFPDMLDNERIPAALSETWRETVIDHPLTWLKVRWTIFARELALTRDSYYVWEPNIVASPYGYTTEFTQANQHATRYMAHFHDPRINGSWVFTVWAYLLVGAIAAVFLVRRWTWTSLTLAAVALAALTYQIGLFFGLLGVGFRFEAPSVLLIELVAVAGIGALAGRLAAVS